MFREKITNRIVFRYDLYVGIIRYGIWNNFDWYIKGLSVKGGKYVWIDGEFSRRRIIN